MTLTAAFIICKALGMTWTWWWLLLTVFIDGNTQSVTIKTSR